MAGLAPIPLRRVRQMHPSCPRLFAGIPLRGARHGLPYTRWPRNKPGHDDWSAMGWRCLARLAFDVIRMKYEPPPRAHRRRQAGLSHRHQACPPLSMSATARPVIGGQVGVCARSPAVKPAAPDYLAKRASDPRDECPRSGSSVTLPCPSPIAVAPATETQRPGR
jgi:hypothetical protein